MSEPSEEDTPPPIANTRRPSVQERVAQRYQKPKGNSGFMVFVGKSVVFIGLALGSLWLYQNVLMKPVEPEKALDPGRVTVQPGSPAGPGTGTEDVAAFERRMEFETAQGVQRQKLAFAKLKQRQVIDLGGSVIKALDDWKAELGRWDGEVQPLLEEDAGKQLAANKPLLKRFRAVYGLERPGKDEEERLRSQAEGIISAAKLAADNPSDSSLPPDAVTTELQGLLRQTKDGRDKYRNGREQISALVRQAKSGTAGTKTLAEASSEQQEEERLASAEVIEAERTKAEEAATAKIAKVKADQARELGLKEEARILADTKSLKAKADSDRIRRLAEDPAIQNQFACFLAPGRFTFHVTDMGQVAEPVSYQVLAGTGHLKDARAFARAMSGQGHWSLDMTPTNDRPHVPYPTNQAEMKRAEQLFELFKELAPTWIKMGKLNP